MIGGLAAEQSLQWSLADQRVFNGICPLARYLVGGVIGPHAPNPLNTGFGAQGHCYLSIDLILQKGNRLCQTHMQ